MRTILFGILVAVLMFAGRAFGTVSGTDVNSEALACNGSTTQFTFTFKVMASTDVGVLLRNTTTGIETEQANGTDFTVTVSNNHYPALGGYITMGAAPSSSYTLTVYRALPLTQQTSIEDVHILDLTALEHQFDRAAMIEQEQRDKINRSIRVPRTDSVSGVGLELPTSTVRASQLLGFDANGAVIVVSAADVNGLIRGLTPFMWTLIDDNNSAEARDTLDINETDLGISGITLTSLGVSAYIQTLLDDANSTAARATLEVNQTTIGVSTFIQTLTDDVDAADARTTLGIITAATLTNVHVYDTGANYVLTTTPALLDGPNDPCVIIPSAGSWLILATCGVDYDAATFADNRMVTIKLRRTNNTAADLENVFNEYTDVTTTKSGSMFSTTFHNIYNTENSNDVIQMWGDVSVLPSAGELTIHRAEIYAIRLGE